MLHVSFGNVIDIDSECVSISKFTLSIHVISAQFNNVK
jgi:hypothetical protein